MESHAHDTKQTRHRRGRRSRSTDAAGRLRLADADTRQNPSTSATANPEPPKTPTSRVAIPFPDITMYSMFTLASDLGYYEEEGLTVEVITADNVTAAVASGSADIAASNPPAP